MSYNGYSEYALEPLKQLFPEKITWTTDKTMFATCEKPV